MCINVCYNGTLNFDEPISDEAVAAIIDILKPTDLDIEVDNYHIDFNLCLQDDPEEKLQQIIKLLDKEGIHMGGRVDYHYYSGFNGSYIVEKNIVEDLREDDMVLMMDMCDLIRYRDSFDRYHQIIRFAEDGDTEKVIRARNARRDDLF